jgi:hypothetical protein
LRAEVDRAIGIAEKKVNDIYADGKKMVAITAGMLVIAMVGTSLFSARRRSKAT